MLVTLQRYENCKLEPPTPICFSCDILSLIYEFIPNNIELCLACFLVKMSPICNVNNNKQIKVYNSYNSERRHFYNLILILRAHSVLYCRFSSRNSYLRCREASARSSLSAAPPSCSASAPPCCTGPRLSSPPWVHAPPLDRFCPSLGCSLRPDRFCRPRVNVRAFKPDQDQEGELRISFIFTSNRAGRVFMWTQCSHF